MNRIKLLPDHIAHKIAAGEVIEGPVSVVKELVENSIDALATSIQVEIKAGGKEYIRVSDNGVGIAPDDLQLAFRPHATSKISSVDDLFTITSLGFRGEALSSIASVSQLVLKSKQKDDLKGYQISFDAKQKPKVEPVGMDLGTTVEVRRLFYNTPARYKFLKTTNTEKRYIVEFISSIAVAHPQIAFRLVADDKIVIQTHGHGKLLPTLTCVFDRHVVDSLISLESETTWGSISGYLTPPEKAGKSRRNQLIFLNGRIIHSPLIRSAVEKAYQGMLAQRTYPIFLINLSINPTLVDVNVHPAKSQVRFENERELFSQISSACKNILLEKDLTTQLTEPQKQSDHAPAAAQTGLNLQQYFPWQPKSWDKVDEYLQQEVGPLAAEEESKNYTLATETPSNVSINNLESKKNITPKDQTSDVKQQLLTGRIIGQFRQTYILLETSSGLWMLDQHIIHERILYERLLKENYQPHVQQVLPHTLDFTPAESNRIRENLEKLNALGLEMEEFGSNTYILRGIPHYFNAKGNINEQDISQLVNDIHQATAPQEKVALTLSCKGAIKAGKHLSNAEIRALLEQLAETENPYTCPHGRPIIVRLDDNEILKRFGR